jgi:hypothetical protein
MFFNILIMLCFSVKFKSVFAHILNYYKYIYIFYIRRIKGAENERAMKDFIHCSVEDLLRHLIIN